jgi:ABC-2 type transport system permease protein
MAKLLAVIKREYLERVRTVWFLIVTLFGPVFFAAIMILPGYLSVKGIRESRVTGLTIVDASGSGLGQRIAERLAVPSLTSGTDASSQARVDIVAPSDLPTIEATLLEAVRTKEITGVLVLDTATVATGRARYFGRDAGSVGTIDAVEGAARTAILATRMQSAGVDAESAAELSRLRVNIAAQKVSDKGIEGSGLASTIFGFGVTFLLYMSILLYGQNVLRGVLEEKTTRVAEVVVSSVSPDTLLAGKIIGVGAVGLTQMLVWTTSGILFWGQRARIFEAMGLPAMPSIAFPAIDPLVLVALILFFVLGYTFYATLFAAVGAMVGSLEEAQQAAQPVMMMLVFSIIFVQPVMTRPDSQLALTMSWLPFSAPIIMPMRMTAAQVPTWEIVGSLLSVTVACVFVTWLSARIYRVGLLMYGKRPSMKELMRWIKQA